MTPLRLFFIRHGQTEAFDNPPFNGWRDAPLTTWGRQQLDDVAISLADIKLDAVYSSDLSRAAYGGLKLAQATGLTLRSDPQWREMSFGQWEGLNYHEICQLNAPLIKKIFSPEGQDIPFPDGESASSFALRIAGALGDLKKNHPQGGRVALVVHGGVCKALWAILLQIPHQVAWQSLRQDFAALNMADIYPNGTCVAHLINAYAGPGGYRQPSPGFHLLAGDDLFPPADE